MILTRLKSKAKSKVIVLSAIAVSVLISILIITAIINSYATGVSINGERVGFVENKEELTGLVKNAKEALSQENQDASIQIKDEAIKFNLTSEPKDEVKMLSGEQLKKKLVSTDSVSVNACAVTVDGEQVLYVGSDTDGNEVLDAIKDKYEVKGQDAVTQFQENVSLENAAVDVNTLMPTETAITYLTTGSEKIKQYKVKDGDTDWDIAIANGMTEKEIQKANPDKDTAIIKDGDMLNINKVTPIVHIEETVTVGQKKQTKFKTSEIETDELYVGESRVQNQGKKGEKLVTKRAIYVNGEEKESDILDEKVIKKAKSKVVAVGTAPKPESSYESGNGSDSQSGDSDSTGGSGSYIGGNGTLSNPMENLEVSSPFGQRNGRLHAGIDFRNPAGTSIYAADGGTVVSSGWQNGYGKSIVINHGNGINTLYGHCSKLFVNSGESVSRGQKIAAVGSTGRSTGNHLHFEVRVNGSPVNPWKYL